MSRPVILLHTSRVHCATFDGLRDQIAPGAELVHHVCEDWLERARNDGVSERLAREIAVLIEQAEGPVLCTCSTLGEAAANAGAIRIDAPMMHRAAQIGGPVLMVYVLESTKMPSEALLMEALERAEQAGQYTTLGLAHLWPLFEAGDFAGFTKAISDAVQSHLRTHSDIRVVVLAQASMAKASQSLNAPSVVVLSSPEAALEAALAAR